MCKDLKFLQRKKEMSEKERIVPIHHQIDKPEVSFNKSFSKPASQENSFAKNFQRKRVFENSIQIVKSSQKRVLDLKSLIRDNRDFYNRSELDADLDTDRDFGLQKSDITGDIGT